MSFKIITLTVLLVAQTYARCGYPWITQLPWYPPYPWYPQHPGYLDALGGAASASAASSAAAAGGSGAASSSASSAASGVATADPVYGSNINGIYGGGFVYPGYIPEYLYPGALGGPSAAAAAASSAAAAGGSGAASSSASSATSGVATADPVYGSNINGIYGGGFVYPGYIPEYLYPGALGGPSAAAASSAAAAGSSGAASSSSTSAASGVSSLDPIYAPSFGGYGCGGIYGGGLVYPGYFPEYLYPGAISGQAAAAAASSAAAAGGSGVASSSASSAASGVATTDPIYGSNINGIYGGGFVYPGYIPEYLYPGALGGSSAAAAAASSAAAAGSSGAASSSSTSAASGVSSLDPIYAPSFGGYGCGGIYGGGLVYPGYFPEYLYPGAISGQAAAAAAAASSAAAAGGSGAASSSASSAASGVATADPIYSPSVGGVYGGGLIYPGYFTEYLHPGGSAAASSASVASGTASSSASSAASTNHGTQLTGFVGGGFGYNHPAVTGFVASSSDAASSSSGFSATGAATSSSTSSASSGADPGRGGWVSFGYAPFPGGYGVNAGAITANSGAAAAASSASAAGVQGYPLSSPLYGGAYPWPCGC